MGNLAIEVDLDQLKDWPIVSVYGADEFLSTEPTEARWVIPGLIPQGVPSILASKGGLGKSMIALQLCIAMATGKPFLTFEAQAPMGAVYFGLEDPTSTVHKRFRSIIATYKHAGDWSPDDESNLRRNFAALFINWQARGATTYLPDLMPNVEHLIRRCASAGVNPGLFVLDTLARFSEGDENTVQALRPVLTACNRIAHHGWSPLMLHHVGKGQDGARNPKAKDKPSLGDRMSTEWVRGSSAIVDNFRCVLQLAAIREDEAERAQLDADKARSNGYLVLGVTKLNGGAKADWAFLEQDEAGAWYAPQDGLEALAALRGAKARAALGKQMAVLVDLYEATRHGGIPDREAMAATHCAGVKNPRGSLRDHFHNLSRAGLIQAKTLVLTPNGMDAIRRLRASDGGSDA